MTRLVVTLVDLQLDAQNFCLFTYNTSIKILYVFPALPCSSSGGLRRNCIYAASVIVTLCRWLSCATVKKEDVLYVNKQEFCASSWRSTKVILWCTVNQSSRLVVFASLSKELKMNWCWWEWYRWWHKLGCLLGATDEYHWRLDHGIQSPQMRQISTAYLSNYRYTMLFDAALGQTSPIGFAFCPLTARSPWRKIYCACI
jgi:hypothetical protein